ncbi:hypothetical protein [Agarivorans aestuarii]|uniref:hypothetical protein n=1 Tax=Agarivorans aestuarii TaxID=1563703 RepID=UPI001C800B12|nr:hypothetical protein [Agarivorans aestuarii]
MNQFTYRVFGYVLPVYMIAGCSQQLSQTESAYQQAVKHAAFPQEQDVSTDLFAVNANNELLQWNQQGDKLLVLTWKSQGAIDKFILPNTHSSTNPNYPIWVSLAPQLQQFCSQYLSDNKTVSQNNLELRLKQYLGLDPSWNYDAFVELYVAPEDLFRPCVDPEIDDQSCKLDASQIANEVKGINDYPGFYQALYFKSFRESAGVPWTGLGYTYDWGNLQSKQGASEYIIAPGAEYQVHAVIPTEQYCR